MVSEKEEKKNSASSSTDSSSSAWPNKPAYEPKEEGMRVWGILVFGFIGAAATTLAVGQLRRTVDWFYHQLTRSDVPRSSFRSNFKEEARRRYQRRMQEEYEEEMERVERIRRMQSVFNKERNKFKRNYESWRENDRGGYNQDFQRDDWYWKTETSFKDRRTNSTATPRASGTYLLSHHYSVLGLDRWRTKPYTEDEIKTAFRTKAKQYHPDQNQANKDTAEAKFKEVMTSYEAIKKERKNGQC